MKCDGFQGPCDSIDAVRFRMNTAYHNEESNFMNLCPYCQKECKEFWDAEWKELNSDIMMGIKDALIHNR